MKKYKLYLFDLDGTLLDSNPMLIETFKYLYKKYKPADFVIDEDHILTFCGPHISDTIRKEFPECDFDAVLNDWVVTSGVNYEFYSKFFPYAKELLEKCVKNGISVGILTNKDRRATNRVFDVFDIKSLNIYSLCGDEAVFKPDPDMIYRAMHDFGITNKDDVVYIGDTNIDYVTARNSGINFGFVNWSPHKLEEGAKIDLLINSFKEMVDDLDD